MMKTYLLRSILIMITLVLVVGCGVSGPKEVVVVKYKHIMPDIPTEYTRIHATPIPPDKQLYLAMDYENKENALTDYSIELLTTLKKYKEQLTSFNEYLAKARSKIEKEDK